MNQKLPHLQGCDGEEVGLTAPQAYVQQEKSNVPKGNVSVVLTQKEWMLDLPDQKIWRGAGGCEPFWGKRD
jgi:hypothetical protein